MFINKQTFIRYYVLKTQNWMNATYEGKHIYKEGKKSKHPWVI